MMFYFSLVIEINSKLLTSPWDELFICKHIWYFIVGTKLLNFIGTLGFFQTNIKNSSSCFYPHTFIKLAWMEAEQVKEYLEWRRCPNWEHMMRFTSDQQFPAFIGSLCNLPYSTFCICNTFSLLNTTAAGLGQVEWGRGRSCVWAISGLVWAICQVLHRCSLGMLYYHPQEKSSAEGFNDGWRGIRGSTAFLFLSCEPRERSLIKRWE